MNKKEQYRKNNLSKYLNIDINDINDENIDVLIKEMKDKKVIDRENKLKNNEKLMIEKLKNNDNIIEDNNLSKKQQNILKKDIEIIKKVYIDGDNEKIDRRKKNKEDKKISDYTLDKLKEYQKKPIYNDKVGKVIKNYYSNKKINDYFKLIDELKEKEIIIDNKIDVNNLEIMKELSKKL